jgi:hypothetical protein
MNAAVLHGLDRVGDLDQLARGCFRIGVGAVVGEFQSNVSSAVFAVRNLTCATRWLIKWIKKTSIVEGTVPTTSPTPVTPALVIAILTIGISRFPGRTIDALGRVCALGHCGYRCQCQSYGNAKKCEFHDASLQSCFTIAFPQAVESIPGRCCGHCRPCCRRARFSTVHRDRAGVAPAIPAP